MAATVGPSKGTQTPAMQPVIIRGICEYVVRTDSIQVCVCVCRGRVSGMCMCEYMYVVCLGCVFWVGLCI